MTSGAIWVSVPLSASEPNTAGSLFKTKSLTARLSANLAAVGAEWPLRDPNASGQVERAVQAG